MHPRTRRAQLRRRPVFAITVVALVALAGVVPDTLTWSIAAAAGGGYVSLVNP
jgi:hypothetical protein